MIDDDDAAPGTRRRNGVSPAPAAARLPGPRWALAFGLALPAAFVFVIAAHYWRDHTATPQEIIVQLPAPADNATSPDSRRDLPADDPGDHP